MRVILISETLGGPVEFESPGQAGSQEATMWGFTIGERIRAVLATEAIYSSPLVGNEDRDS